MMLLCQKKAAFACISGLLVMILVSFISCQKELSSETNNFISATPDFSSKVNSSLTGFITDENENVVVGATVKAGSITTITDKYGYFEIRNAKLAKNAGVVIVSKPGYFKGIKTFVAVENKKAFFRIQLIPKITTGTIDATIGGTVTLTGGLSVSFKANTIINDADKTLYTGIVNVASYWIDPTGSKLNKIMPGDLRGITTEGSTKMLATYGMAAVELTGTFGELLQIAPDKKATFSFPIPPSISGTAPPTIPLWYFDETNGLWKEQGTATKQGDSYVGDVSHFSYWNCDKPFANAVNFSCTIADVKGHPLSNVEVDVHYDGNNEYTGCHGLTDSDGYISGAIPADAQLTVQVYGSSNCSTPSYIEKITTTNANVSLGTIILPNDRTIVLTGNAINCSSAPVKNGYIILNDNGQYSRYTLSNNGSFSISHILCSNSPEITLLVEDKDALQQSIPIKFTLTSSTNVGTLKACGTSVAEFINYSIDGNLFSFTSPGDEFYHFSNQGAAIRSDDITVYNISNNNTNSVYISITHTGIAVGSSQKLLQFMTTVSTDSLVLATPIQVKITEYSMASEFIAGNFSGTLTQAFPPYLPHSVICSFRVKRQ